MSHLPAPPATCSSSHHCYPSFNTGTKEAIKKQLQQPLCGISTIDEFQGKEADIVILVTTRTCGSGDAVFSFISDRQRALFHAHFMDYSSSAVS